MRKFLAVVISAMLLISVVLSVPFSTLAEESINYYKEIDFSESQYPSNHLYNASLVDDVDPNHGKSVKITSIKGNKNDARYASACIRLVDETGANNGQLYLEPNTKYRISFDIKVVSSESTIVSVGVKNLTNGNIPDSSTKNFLTPTHYNTSDLVGKGYVRKEIEINNTKGNLNTRALFFVYSNNTGRTDYGCEIYIDNIVIAEQTAITYFGADDAGLPATAYANDTYEKILGAQAGSWYLDPQRTKPATGIINAKSVTLYPAIDYYSEIDFTESGYASGNKNNDDIILADEAIKFTTVRVYSQRKSARTIRLVNNAGTSAYVLQPSTKYRVTYNIKAVNAPSSFNVGLYFVTTNNPTPGGIDPSYTHTYSFSEAASEYTTKSFEFTSSATENVKVLMGLYCSSAGIASDDVTGCEIYIDNIVIAAQTTLSYSGAAATGLPTTAWANQTYEQVLGSAAGKWFFDEECTRPATGIINAKSVTLYHEINYYSDIDFTESAYANGANVADATKATLTENADATYGNAMKFSSLRVYSQRHRATTLRFVDTDGTAMLQLQPSTKYRVTYDIKAVSAPQSFYVGLYFVTNNNPTPGGTYPSYTHQYTTANIGSNYNSNVFEFTSPANANTKVLLGIFNAASSPDNLAAEIYIDNIVIAQQTVFTYQNGEGVEGLPASAWANQTYEEVFDSIAGFDAIVYTDASKQNKATGVINKKEVTLYPKSVDANIVDFEESVYNGEPIKAVSNLKIAPNADAGAGAAGKITGLRHSSDANVSTFKLSNRSENGFLKLEKGSMYTVTYDIKQVKADVAFNVGIGTTANANSADYSLSKKDVQVLNKHNKGNSATWQSIPVTGQFTAKNSGEALIVIYHESADTAKPDGQEVYIDNIKITKLKSRDLVLHLNNGESDTKASVAEYSKFEELTIPTRENYIFTGWFLNSALTSKAEGQVGATTEVWAGWVERATYTTVTFDEPNVTFSPSGSDTWKMTETSTQKNYEISARSVEIGTTKDKNGKTTNAAHFRRARDLERPHPANVRVYSTVPVIDGAFLMDTYSAYDITFRYRADDIPSNTLYFNVLGVFPLGSPGNPMNSKYERSRILAYAIESVSDMTDGWKTVTCTFYTNSNKLIPHITLVSSTTKEASNVDVWVDNITVSKRNDVKKISFNTNGGNSLSDMNVIVGTVPPAFPVPVKENKTFAGWFTDAQCTVPFTDSLMPNNDILLYAGWSDKVTTPTEFESGFGPEDYTYANVGNTQITDNAISVGATLDSNATGTYVDKGSLIFNDLTGTATQSASRHIAVALKHKNGENFNVIKGCRYKLTLVASFNGGPKAAAYINLVINNSTPNGGINKDNSINVFNAMSNDKRHPLLNEWYTFEQYFIASDTGKVYLTHYSNQPMQNIAVDYVKVELVEDGEASLVEYWSEDGTQKYNEFFGKTGSVLVDSAAVSKKGYSFNGWRIGSSKGEQWLSNKFPAQDIKLYASFVEEEPLPENPKTDFSKPVTVTFEETKEVKAFYGDQVAFGGGAGGSTYGMYAVANNPEGARNGSGYFRLHYSGHSLQQYYRKLAFFHADSPGNRIWLEPESVYRVSYWYNPDEVGATNLYTVALNSEYEYGYQILAENYLQDAAIANQFGKWNYYEAVIVTDSLTSYLGFAVGGGLLSASIDDITVTKLKPVYITLETNGGNNIPMISQLSESYLVFPGEPEREGYDFVGWYSDKALTKPFDFENTLVNENMTLYAKWEPKKYKTVVTYTDKETEIDVVPEDAHLDDALNVNDRDEIGNIKTAKFISGSAYWLWIIVGAGALLLVSGGVLLIVLIKKRKGGRN